MQEILGALGDLTVQIVPPQRHALERGELPKVRSMKPVSTLPLTKSVWAKIF